jgi:tRNA pseudouridine55 synthase
MGVSSPSSDTETEVTIVSDAPIPTLEQLADKLSLFRGTISQTPPIYSALRIDGKRAYDLARAGETPDIPARQVSIWELEILSYDYPRLVLRIACSTGTYIRSIGRDLARSLYSDAIMIDLIRTRIGPFESNDCVSLESLDSRDKILEAVRSPLLALESFPKLTPSAEELQRLKDGQNVRLESNCVPPLINCTSPSISISNYIRWFGTIPANKRGKWKSTFLLTDLSSRMRLSCCCLRCRCRCGRDL